MSYRVPPSQPDYSHLHSPDMVSVWINRILVTGIFVLGILYLSP